MQIIKKDRPETVIEVGDLVIESESDIACIVGYDGEESHYPCILISVQTGEVVNGYHNVSLLSETCTLLAKNKDITLTY